MRDIVLKNDKLRYKVSFLLLVPPQETQNKQKQDNEYGPQFVHSIFATLLNLFLSIVGNLSYQLK